MIDAEVTGFHGKMSIPLSQKGAVRVQPHAELSKVDGVANFKLGKITVPDVFAQPYRGKLSPCAGYLMAAVYRRIWANNGQTTDIYYRELAGDTNVPYDDVEKHLSELVEFRLLELGPREET